MMRATILSQKRLANSKLIEKITKNVIFYLIFRGLRLATNQKEKDALTQGSRYSQD